MNFKCSQKRTCGNAPWCLNCHPLSCGRSCPCCQNKCKPPRSICCCLPQPTHCQRYPSIVAKFDPPPMCRGRCDCCCRPICNRECPLPRKCPSCCGSKQTEGKESTAPKNWLFCRPIFQPCDCVSSYKQPQSHCVTCPSTCSCYPPRCGSATMRRLQ